MSKEKMTALQQLVEETLPTLLPEKDGYNDVLVDAMAYSLDAALFIQSVKRDVENIRSRL